MTPALLADTSTSVTSPLMTAEDTGSYLHVHPRTLANWRVLGRGPRYVRVGKTPYYRPADVEEWLDRHSFDHTSAEAGSSV